MVSGQKTYNTYGLAAASGQNGYFPIGVGQYEITYPVPANPSGLNQAGTSSGFAFSLSVVYPVNPANLGLLTSCTVWNVTAPNNKETVEDYARPEGLIDQNGTSLGFKGGWNTSQVGEFSQFLIVDYSSSSYSSLVQAGSFPTGYAVNMYHFDSRITVNNIIVGSGNIGQTSFLVSYTPGIIGKHVMNITRLGSQATSYAVIAGATDPVWQQNWAWVINVGPGRLSSFQSSVYGLLQTDLRVVGQTYVFTLQPRDSFSNAISNSSYVFTAIIDFSNRYAGVFNVSDNLYYFSYTAQMAGYKSVQIVEASFPPAAFFGGQTFPINFVAAPPDHTTTDCSLV